MSKEIQVQLSPRTFALLTACVKDSELSIGETVAEIVEDAFYVEGSKQTTLRKVHRFIARLNKA